MNLPHTFTGGVVYYRMGICALLFALRRDFVNIAYRKKGSEYLKEFIKKDTLKFSKQLRRFFTEILKTSSEFNKGGYVYLDIFSEKEVLRQPELVGNVSILLARNYKPHVFVKSKRYNALPKYIQAVANLYLEDWGCADFVDFLKILTLEDNTGNVHNKLLEEFLEIEGINEIKSLANTGKDYIVDNNFV